MTYYAVTRTQTWDRPGAMHDQPGWDEHAAFMHELFDEGFLALVGPLDGGPKVLLVVSADDEDSIHARLADDPWTKTGLLVTDSVVRWDIRIGDPSPRTPTSQRS